MRPLALLLLLALLCGAGHAAMPLAGSRRQVAIDHGVPASRRGLHDAGRTTILINPHGKIAKIYQDVDPQQNSAQVLRDLAALKAAS